MTIEQLMEALTYATLRPRTEPTGLQIQLGDCEINLIRVVDDDGDRIEIEVLDRDGAPEASFTIKQNVPC